MFKKIMIMGLFTCVISANLFAPIGKTARKNNRLASQQNASPESQKNESPESSIEVFRKLVQKFEEQGYCQREAKIHAEDAMRTGDYEAVFKTVGQVIATKRVDGFDPDFDLNNRTPYAVFTSAPKGFDVHDEIIILKTKPNRNLSIDTNQSDKKKDTETGAAAAALSGNSSQQENNTEISDDSKK